MTENGKLQELLQKLVQTIHSTINEGLAKGTLQPRPEPYFRWKLTEFEYGDTGIVKSSAKGEELLKPYWGIATRNIFQKISKIPIHKDALALISKGYEVEEAQCERYLEALITKVAGNILAGKIKNLSESARYVTSFLKDLNGESQEYRAEVKLAALVLQPRLIQLDSNVRLRKPARKDFEREPRLGQENGCSIQ